MTSEHLLISQFFVGLSFLAEGIDRLILVGLSLLWFIGFIIVEVKQ